MHFSSDFVARVKSFRTNVVLLASVLLIFTIFTGCAIDRNVRDNRFYSSYPRMTIDVDKEFIFLGSDKYTPAFAEPGDFWFTAYDGAHFRFPKENNFYFFVPKKIMEQTIPRGILIQILVPVGGYRTSANTQDYLKINDQSKNILDHNIKSFGKNTHEYYTIVLSRAGYFDLTQWLNQKGYLFPSCTVERHIVESGGDGQVKEIIYFEDAKLSGNNCIEWRGNLAEFTERADKAVQLIKF